MFIQINFEELTKIIKYLKNKALQIEVESILKVIKEQSDSCNQQYEKTQNDTDAIIIESLTQIKTKLEKLAKLIEQGDIQKSLVPIATEKQQLHLIYLTLQQALPGTLDYPFHQLIQLKNEKGAALTPTRTLINHAARNVFKAFLQQEVKSFIQALGAPRKVFISYAWANPTFATYHRDKVYEGMVTKLASDLEIAGCHVFLDHWYDQAGKPLTEFLELMGQADCFMPIGTQLYLHKYNKRAEHEKAREHMVRAEGEILNYIATYSSEWRNKIKPILFEGTSEETLPLLIRPNSPLMLHQTDYVASFFHLIRSVYDIDNRDTEFKQLERKCYQALNKLADKEITELQAIIANYKAMKTRYPSSKPKLWTGEIAKSSHFWHVPVLSPNFIGRIELLNQLHIKLTSQDQQPVAITACHGLGGVGKTQLVLKYVYDHRHEYSHVFWVSAENEEQLQLDYRALADKLQLSTESLSRQEIADQVKAWLERNPGWLVVYDNVSDAKLITQYRPRIGGKIVVTSREQVWDKNLCLPVDVFSSNESCEYIATITGFLLQENQSTIDELAKMLGHLPLALAQACAYIAVNQISLQDYFKLYEANRMEMLADKTLPSDVQHEPIAITWRVTFKAIIAQQPSAWPLLISCAYLYADDIFEKLLKELFYAHLSNAAEKKFIEALSCLQRYSLLKPISLTEKTFSMHRLVQEVIRHDYKTVHSSIPANELPHKLEILLKCLFEPLQGRRREDYCLVIRKNIKRIKHCNNFLKDIIKHYEVAADLINYAVLIADLLLEYGDQNHVLQAIDYYRQILKILKQQLGPTHFQTAKIYNNLGSALQALRNQNSLQEAIKCHQEALSVQIKQLDPTHLDISASYNNLAMALQALGDQASLKDAILYHQKALNNWKQQLGSSHPNIALSYNNLALALQALGGQDNINTAIDYLHKGRRIWKQQLGSSHPNVALNYNNLGMVLQALEDQDNIKTAIDYLHKGRLIWKQQLGSNHPNVALSYNNLAMALQASTNPTSLKEALKYIYKAINIQEEQLGLMHPDLARSYNNLGIILQNLEGQNNINKAVQYHRKSLSIWEQQLGSNHPNVAIGYSNLGGAMQALEGEDNFKAAIQHHHQALSILEQQFGSTHPQVGKIQINLATVYKEVANTQKALEHFQKAYHIFLLHPDYGLQHSFTQDAKKEIKQLTGTIMEFSTHGFFSQPKLNHESKIEPLKVLLTYYNLEKEVIPLAYEIALRRAAAGFGPSENLVLLLNIVEDVNVQDNKTTKRKTALHWAVEKGQVANVKLLLSAGARTDIKDASHKTAIDYAQTPEIRRLLLSLDSESPSFQKF